MKYHWSLGGRDLILPVLATLICFWIGALLPLPPTTIGRIAFSFLHLMGSIASAMFVWLVFFVFAKKTLQ